MLIKYVKHVDGGTSLLSHFWRWSRKEQESKVNNDSMDIFSLSPFLLYLPFSHCTHSPSHAAQKGIIATWWAEDLTELCGHCTLSGHLESSLNTNTTPVSLIAETVRRSIYSTSSRGSADMCPTWHGQQDSGGIIFLDPVHRLEYRSCSFVEFCFNNFELWMHVVTNRKATDYKLFILQDCKNRQHTNDT